MKTRMILERNRLASYAAAAILLLSLIASTQWVALRPTDTKPGPLPPNLSPTVMPTPDSTPLAASTLVATPSIDTPFLTRGVSLWPFDAVGEDHLWVVLGSTLYHTTNEGQHWDAQFSTNSFISSVDFVDQEHGWMVADRTIFNTEDGGQNWVKADRPANRKPDRLHFVSDLEGWVADDLYENSNPLVSITTNGGQSWDEIPTDGDHIGPWPHRPCNWHKHGGILSFTSLAEGWAVCSPNRGSSGPSNAIQMYKTHDAGKQWSRLDPPVQDPFTADLSVLGLFFIDMERGWYSSSIHSAESDSMVVLRATTDGGATWKRIATPDKPLFGLQFLSPMDGYALYGSFDEGSPRALVETHDGGATWTSSVVAYPVLPAKLLKP